MKLILFLVTFFPFLASAEFSGEETATVNLTGGNTDLKTYAFDSQNKFELTKHQWQLNGNYNYGESDGDISVENWMIGAKYLFKAFKKLSFTLGQQVEANRFAGIKRRYNSDLGVKLKILEKEKYKFFSELGLRYTEEELKDTSLGERKDTKGRVYLEGRYKLKNELSSKLWVEYLPNFTSSQDYLINVEPSLIVTLSSLFSMKSAYIWRYDNFPTEGNSKHDYSFTLSLIANI